MNVCVSEPYFSGSASVDRQPAVPLDDVEGQDTLVYRQGTCQGTCVACQDWVYTLGVS